jgi:plastocyanin
LTASGRDPGGSKVNGVTGFTFTSDDQNVATVSTTGLVNGVGLGTANITAEATSGSTTHSIASAITVTDQSFPATATISGLVNPIVFSPSTVDISAGGTVTFHFSTLAHTVVFADQTGAPADIAATSNDDVDRTFSQAGTFNFECIIHPGMSGTVIVH